jgi:hypothetical protein
MYEYYVKQIIFSQIFVVDRIAVIVECYPVQCIYYDIKHHCPINYNSIVVHCS